MKDTNAENYYELGRMENEQSAVSSSKEIVEDEEKQRERWKNGWLERLEKLRFSRKEYSQALVELLDYLLGGIEYGEGYKTEVKSDDRGIVLKLGKLDRTFAMGIQVIGEPKYDFQAMISVSLRCENTVDKLEGRTEDNGIIVPQ